MLVERWSRRFSDIRLVLRRLLNQSTRCRCPEYLLGGGKCISETKDFDECMDDID